MSEKIDIRSEAFEVRTEKNEEGKDEVTIRGIAVPYEKESRNGVIYTEDSIKAAAESLVGKPFLFNHNPDKVLGKVTEAIPKDTHLEFVAVANPSKEKVQDIVNGYVSTVSIQAMVDETEEGPDNRLNVNEFLELSSAPIPGFDDAKAQAQTVRIEEFDVEEQNKVIINEPNVEGSEEEKWDPAEKEEYSSDEQFYNAHMVWYKENPDSVDDVSFEVARNHDGKLYVNYEALNSAYDLAKNADDITMDDVTKLRSKLKGLREKWFPDRESLDGDASEEDKSKEPFAGYKDFDECVADNQDKKDPEAYCAVIKRKVEDTPDDVEDMEDMNTMSDEEEDTSEEPAQEQDIEDLGDALDWVEANAPEEVANMIVDAIRGEEESADNSEDKVEQLEKRVKELEKKLEGEEDEEEEVEESKQPNVAENKEVTSSDVVEAFKNE